MLNRLFSTPMLKPATFEERLLDCWLVATLTSTLWFSNDCRFQIEISPALHRACCIAHPKRSVLLAANVFGLSASRPSLSRNRACPAQAFSIFNALPKRFHSFVHHRPQGLTLKSDGFLEALSWFPGSSFEREVLRPEQDQTHPKPQKCHVLRAS